MKYLLVLLLLLTGCGQDDGQTTAAPITKDNDAPNEEVITETEPTGEANGNTDDETAEADDGDNPVVLTLADAGWDDPVTGRHWALGDIVNAVDATCAVGYEVPDIWDLGEANANGLPARLAAESIDGWTWTKNLSDGVVESLRNLNDTSQWQNTLTGGRLWCVEEN